MSESLGDLDIRILDLMQKDASIALNDLAEKVASSRSAVWRRIQKMQDAGIIRKITAVLDPEKVGLGVLIFAHIKLKAHGRETLPHVMEEIRAFPEVVECYTTMGPIDFIVKIRVKDIHAYEELFWTRLSQIEGIGEISSTIALTAVKDTTELRVRAR